MFPVSTRDTVGTETPATRATSAIVGGLAVIGGTFVRGLDLAKDTYLIDVFSRPRQTPEVQPTASSLGSGCITRPAPDLGCGCRGSRSPAPPPPRRSHTFTTEPRARVAPGSGL